MTSNLNRFVLRLTRAVPRSRPPRLATSALAPSSTRIGNPHCRSWTSALKPRIGWQRVPSGTKHMATKAASAADTADISNILRPEVLQGVWDFWFSHIVEEENAVVPKAEQNLRWFSGGDEFDSGCSQRFLPTLEALVSLNPSPESLLEVLEDAPSKFWAALVILLDQVPRNCFRGSHSVVVFEFFDPLARAVTERAIELGVPVSPDFKYYITRRMWFYLPLMHSEMLSMHVLALAQFQQMSDEFRALLADPAAATTEQDRKCGEILARNKEATEHMLDMNYGFEKKHYDIIAMFGRYPHRNGPLGRDMTPAEQEYLDNGGETFAAKKD